MIQKIKASKSEKIIFIFIVTLAIFFFGSFFLIKDKCLFVKNYDPLKITFSDFDALIFWIIKQNFHLFLKD